MGHLIELPGQMMMDITESVAVNLAQLVALAQTQPGWTRLWLRLAPDERTRCRFYMSDGSVDSSESASPPP